jgi:hypothetical protein
VVDVLNKHILDNISKLISELQEIVDTSVDNKMSDYDRIELFVINFLLQYLYDMIYLKTLVENMVTKEMIDIAKETANSYVQELKKVLGLDDEHTDGYQYLDEYDVHNIRLILMIEYLLKELGKDPEEMNLFVGQRMKEMGIKFVPIDQLSNVNKIVNENDDMVDDEFDNDNDDLDKDDDSLL